MDLMKPLLNPKRKVVQLHFGGGTPTFSLPDEIRRLGEMIHSRFTFAPDVEAGVEVDPRRLTRDHLVALREVGFNRGSMGVQDDDPVVQKAVHRIQPFEMTRQVVEWMREVGLSLRQHRPDLRPALSDAAVLCQDARGDSHAEAGPLCRLQLRPCAVDEAGAEDSEARGPALAGNQAGVAQADHRAADFRGLRVYRHGPLRARGRRAGRGAAAEDVAAQFPGLQHARRGGHLRVRHVVHLAGGGLLLAEPQGAAGLLRRRWTPASCRCTAATS